MIMATAPAPAPAFAFATDSAPIEIGMLLYPNMTLLDLAGPQAALGIHGRTHLFWKTLDPVLTDSGVTLMPTATFADAPAALDVLFVPGGAGTVDAMKDEAINAFLAERGRDARYITSVCTGSLLLGTAGLLDGYRAATHWAAYDILDALGIEAGHERVVVDRNRFTGGGVTAGIDFGLTLLAELRGEEVAKMTQLMLEYDPAPPFATGHPRNAGPELVAAVKAMVGDPMAEGIEIARARRTREPVPA